MMQYIRDNIEVFKRYKPLLQNLVMRDIKVKYRRSALGVAWSVLNPLLMMAVQALVFSYLFRNTVPNFPVYLLSGQIMFNFFTESTNLALDSVLGGSGLLKKVYIPKYIFPLEKVIFSLVNMAFSLIALVIVIIFTGQSVTAWILLLPVTAAILFTFNLGLGLILAAFTVFFRDVKHFYGVLIVALTYFTPLFYVPNDMNFPSWMFTLLKFNPLYWFVGMSRQLILYGEAPTAAMWGVTCGCAVVALSVGLLVFKKTQDKFILHI